MDDDGLEESWEKLREMRVELSDRIRNARQSRLEDRILFCSLGMVAGIIVMALLGGTPMWEQTPEWRREVVDQLQMEHQLEYIELDKVQGHPPRGGLHGKQGHTEASADGEPKIRHECGPGYEVATV